MSEKFDINGSIIIFSEEKVRYNSIRKEFLKQAKIYSEEFIKEFGKNYKTKDLSEAGIKLYELYI